MSGTSRINLCVCAILLTISTTTSAQIPQGSLQHAYTMEWYLARGKQPKSLTLDQWNQQAQQHSRMIRSIKTSNSYMVSIDAKDDVRRLVSARNVRGSSSLGPINHEAATWSFLDGLIVAWEGKLEQQQHATPESSNLVSNPEYIQHTLAAYRKMIDSAKQNILEADDAAAREIVKKFRACYPILVTTDWFEAKNLQPSDQTEDQWSVVLAKFTNWKLRLVDEFAIIKQQLAEKREQQVVAVESALRLAEQAWRDGSANQDEPLIKRMSWLLHTVDLELTKLQLRDMKDQSANDQTHQHYTSQQRQMAFDFFVQLSIDICDPNAVARTN